MSNVGNLAAGAHGRAAKLSTAHANFQFERNAVALYWGYVQGLEARSLFRRYVPDEELTDLRLVAQRVRLIAADLATAARRSRRPEIAALFVRDPQLIDTGAPEVSLETFREQSDPDGFYSEAELIAQHREQHGGTERYQRAMKRRGRLLERIGEALAWIQTQSVQMPDPKDLVSGWFPAIAAARLEAAGLGTMAQLVSAINRDGRNWHRAVRGIGETKARSIESWVRLNGGSRLMLAASAGMTRYEAGRVPEAARAHRVIAPLEDMVMQPELDGGAGRFRALADLCALSATTDLAAAQAWLATTVSPNTFRSYRREVERVMLWCSRVRKVAFSSMTVEDCEAYRQFMRNPEPTALWCGPPAPRWTYGWRPFEGPLNKPAERHALTVISAFVSWLRENNYLTANAWTKLVSNRGVRARIDKSRALTRKQWSAVVHELNSADDTIEKLRLKFVIWLFYGTGLRLGEAAKGKFADLSVKEFEDDEWAWALAVEGKGHEERVVFLVAEVVESLQRYMVARGLGGDPREVSGDEFLVGSLAPKATGLPQGVTDGSLARQVKQLFERAAKRLTDKDRAALLKASAHCLRHTFATELIRQGEDLAVARDLLGHASIATTSVYVESDDLRRVRAQRKLVEAGRRRAGGA